jgi:hypothetical protein
MAPGRSGSEGGGGGAPRAPGAPLAPRGVGRSGQRVRHARSVSDTRAVCPTRAQSFLCRKWAVNLGASPRAARAQARRRSARASLLRGARGGQCSGPATLLQSRQPRYCKVGSRFTLKKAPLSRFTLRQPLYSSAAALLERELALDLAVHERLVLALRLLDHLAGRTTAPVQGRARPCAGHARGVCRTRENAPSWCTPRPCTSRRGRTRSGPR